jgi:hypothetical protein
MDQPSLFIPPPEFERRTLEMAIANSNDIGVVKKLCQHLHLAKMNY